MKNKLEVLYSDDQYSDGTDHSITDHLNRKCALQIKCSLFQTTKELLVNKKDLQALTLVGPTRQDSVLNTLAVLGLDK